MKLNGNMPSSKKNESLWTWLVRIAFSEEMEFRLDTKNCKERNTIFEKENYMGNLKAFIFDQELHIYLATDISKC